MPTSPDPSPETTLSVLILTRDEAENLDRLLPALGEVLDDAGVAHEVVIVDADSPDGSAKVAAGHGARVLQQDQPGYANALRQGMAACRGAQVLTLDADFSHRPEVALDLLAAASDADLVVASRYVPGGAADMPASRRVLSRILCGIYGTLLALPVRDLSSGFRLYRREVLDQVRPRGAHFDVLPEILARIHIGGGRIREIPFHYRAREAGVSKARAVRFAPAYLRTLARCMWSRWVAPRPVVSPAHE